MEELITYDLKTWKGSFSRTPHVTLTGDEEIFDTTCQSQNQHYGSLYERLQLDKAFLLNSLTGFFQGFFHAFHKRF